MKNLLLSTALIVSVNSTSISASSIYDYVSTIPNVCTSTIHYSRSICSEIKKSYDYAKSVHADIKENSPITYGYVANSTNIAYGAALSAAIYAISTANIPIVSTAVAFLAFHLIMTSLEITLAAGVLEYKTPKIVKKTIAFGASAKNMIVGTADYLWKTITRIPELLSTPKAKNLRGITATAEPVVLTSLELANTLSTHGLVLGLSFIKPFPSYISDIKVTISSICGKIHKIASGPWDFIIQRKASPKSIIIKGDEEKSETSLPYSLGESFYAGIYAVSRVLKRWAAIHPLSVDYSHD